MLLQVGNSLSYSGNVFGLVIGNRDVKFFFKFHDQFHGIQHMREHLQVRPAVAHHRRQGQGDHLVDGVARMRAGDGGRVSARFLHRAGKREAEGCDPADVGMGVRAGGRLGWTREWVAEKVEHAERYGTEPVGALR